MRASSSAIICLLAVAAAGCDDETSTPDGGPAPTRDAAAGDTPIAPPAAPEPPTMTPCPSGWREAEVDDLVVCEPWPDSGPPACVPGTMALPGVDGCAPLGAECSGDALPAEPATGGPFVYVLAGSTDGDGSRFAPFATIAEAMDFASPGTTILLGEGTYDELVAPIEDVTLRGVCPRRTVLTRTDDGAGEAVVRITRDGVTLRDLSIAGSTRFFGVVARAGTTRLEGIVVEDIGQPGIGVADAAVVELVGSSVRRCAHGVEVIVGGEVRVEGSVVEDNAGPGVVAIGGRATVTGSWIAGNRNVGEPGFGALAQDDGFVRVEASVVSGNQDIGLTAGAGGVVEAEASLIEDQRTDPLGDAGFGVEAEGGGEVRLARVALRANRMGAIFIQGEGTRLTASDLWVVDTQPRGDGMFGRGLVVQDGASATVERAVVADSRGSGVIVSGRGGAASLELTDVAVRDTQPQPADGEAGRGITAQYEATVALTRVRVERCHGVAVHVAGREASLPTATLADVAIVDSFPETDQGVAGVHGRGLQIEQGAAVTGARISIERAHEVGLAVFEATATLEDVTVEDTLARAIDDAIGRGVVVQGSLTLDRALVSRSRGVGLHVATDTGDLDARDVTIRDTLPRGCAQTTCVDFGAGHGLGVYEGATAALDRFRIERAALCGAQLATGASLDLQRGVIREAAVGACVQVDGYDVTRLSEDVRYEDNDANLEATYLPIPAPLDPLTP